jgi:WD40 repeat protein
VVVWRLADRSVLWRETDLAQVMKVAFSDDGQWLAACTWGPPANIHLWSTPERRRVAVWPADDGLGMALAFAPGGRELVSAGSAQVISRWGAGTTNLLGQLKGHLHEVWCLRFARDGRLVSGSKDGRLRVWKAAGLPPNRRSFTVPTGRLAVPLASGARKLTTFKPQEWVFEDWDLATGQLLAKRPIERGEDLLGGGKVSTNAGTYFNCGLLDLSLKGKVIWLCVGVPGWELFATTADGWLHGWSAETGRLLFSRQVLAGPFLCIGLSPDRQRFPTVELSGTLKVWNIQGTEPEAVFDYAAAGRPYAYARSSDGALIAFHTKANEAVVWDTHTRTRRAVVPCALWGEGYFAFAISPDKRLMAVANNNQPAQIWDIAAGRPLTGLLYGHVAGIDRVSFSPDNRLLVTYCADRTAKVWSVETGQEVLSGIRLNDLLYANPIWQLFVDKDTMIENAGTNSIRLVPLPTLAEIDSQDPERQKIALARQRRAGSIQEWLVLAPFPFPRGQSGGIALDQQQLPNEHQLRPRAGEVVRTGSRRLAWRTVRATSGILDLDGPQNEYAAGYAVCYLRSPRERNGLVMHVASDDQAKVYLNGKLLLRSAEPRTFDFDQNTIPNVSLQPGVNVLVLKLVNEAGDWRGAIRITDAQGRPVKDVQISLKPE